MPRPEGLPSEVTPTLTALLADVDTAYLATASADGEPYAQHRGGPRGFIQALDDRTLAMPDFAGNRQYLTIGNLAENARAFLFLMDYARRRRAKVWGRAHVSNEPALLARLAPRGYKARIERAIVITIDAWDLNCPAHIPQKVDAVDVAAVLAARDARIAELEQQLARARATGST